MSITNLPLEFVGTGEVQDYHFEQIAANHAAYVYAVTRAVGAAPQYEVIKRINSPICIDFANKIYSETDFKESYPKAKAFGKSAWAYVTESEAMDKFNQLGTQC